MNQASFGDVVAFLFNKKYILFFGAMVGVFFSVSFSALTMFILGGALHPFQVAHSLTFFYITLSYISKENELMFVQESICYWLASVLIFIFLGSSFSPNI